MEVVRRSSRRPVRRAVAVLALATVAVLPGAPALASRSDERASKPEPGPLAKMDHSLLEGLIAETSRRPFMERLDRWSQRFLGTPYLLDPLGEGPGASIGPDPLYDVGRVDCQ